MLIFDFRLTIDHNASKVAAGVNAVAYLLVCRFNSEFALSQCQMLHGAPQLLAGDRCGLYKLSGSDIRWQTNNRKSAINANYVFQS